MKKGLALVICFSLILSGCSRGHPEDDASSNALQSNVITLATYLVDSAVIDAELYPYYGSLNDNMKEVYKELYCSFKNQLTDFYVSTNDTEELFQCYSSVLLEHPEIFYLNGYSYSMNEDGTALIVHPKYTMSASEIEANLIKCENYVRRVLSEIPENATDYEKIQYVYHYLASNTYYGRCLNDQNVMSVVNSSKSVCLGYSLIYQYCLQKLKIPNVVVTGTAYGTDHAWNVLKLGNNWYNSDVTWASQTYWEHSNSAKKRVVTYDYFMVSDAYIGQNHTCSMSLYVPPCTDDSMDYYRYNGLYINRFDADYLMKLFQDAIVSNKKDLTIKCDNYDLFLEVRSYLIEDSNIFDFTETTECTYTYDLDRLTLTFWF